MSIIKFFVTSIYNQFKNVNLIYATVPTIFLWRLDEQHFFTMALMTTMDHHIFQDVKMYGII